MPELPDDTFDLRLPAGLSDAERADRLRRLANALAKADRLEMVVCDEGVDRTIATDESAAVVECNHKVVVVVNYRPCVNKMLDPRRVASDDVFDRSPVQQQTYPAEPGTA